MASSVPSSQSPGHGRSLACRRSPPGQIRPISSRASACFLVFLVAVLLWSPVDRLSAFPFNLGSIDVVACPLTFVILSAFFFPSSVGVQRSSAVHFILWVFLSTFPSPLLRCQSFSFTRPVSGPPLLPPVLTTSPLCPLLPEDSTWSCTVSAITVIISSYSSHPFAGDYT